MLITTKRGLKLEIPEAEIFSELNVGNITEEQRDVALQLFRIYMDDENYKNSDKALKYAILATGGKPADVFKFSYTDAFNWYNVLRVFVGSINRLLKILAKPFLPLWYPLTGLFYAVQVLVAHKEGNKEGEFYWSAWMIFNGFTALVLFGVLAASGVGLAIAALTVTLYGFVFDVKWDVYKYATERSKHENLLNKINENLFKSIEPLLDDPKQFKNFKNKSDEKIIELIRDEISYEALNSFKNKLFNDPLRNKLLKDIQKIKGDRIEAGMIDTTILIGGFLFCLSASLPPLFASLGASFIFGAFSYLVAKKTYNSWTSPTGFLNHHVRQPFANLYKRCESYLKNAFQPNVILERAKVKGTLHIQTSTIQSLVVSNPSSPPLSPLSTSTILTLPEIHDREKKSSRSVLTPEIVQELENAKYIVEAVCKLSPKDQRTVKKTLTSELKMQNWNQVIDIYVQKYKDQKQGVFYTCSLKQTIKTCMNHHRSNLNDLKKNKNTDDEKEIQEFEREINFLRRMENKCNGRKSDDLALVDVDPDGFDKEIDFDHHDRFHLLKLLGITNSENYKTQYSHWEKYYDNGMKVNSPFFDRHLNFDDVDSVEERSSQPTQADTLIQVR